MASSNVVRDAIYQVVREAAQMVRKNRASTGDVVHLNWNKFSRSLSESDISHLAQCELTNRVSQALRDGPAKLPKFISYPEVPEPRTIKLVFHYETQRHYFRDENGNRTPFYELSVVGWETYLKHNKATINGLQVRVDAARKTILTLKKHNVNSIEELPEPTRKQVDKIWKPIFSTNLQIREE